MTSDQGNVLKLKVITPEKIVYDKNVVSVSIPTKDGIITVLPKHIPLISALGKGEMLIKEESGSYIEPFALYQGVLEVRRNGEVIILTESTEPVSEIDEEKTKEAYERAKAYLEEKKDISDIEYARFQAMLEQNLNRMSVLRKYREKI